MSKYYDKSYKYNDGNAHIYGTIAVVMLIVGIITTIGAMSIAEINVKAARYEEACLLASSSSESDLTTAYSIFLSVGDYKDSQRYLSILESRISTGLHNWYQRGDIQWCSDCGAIMYSNGDITLPSTMIRMIRDDD